MHLFTATIFCLLTFSIPFEAAAQDKASITVNTGYAYTHGDYGLGDDTSMRIIPLSITYNQGPWSFKVGVSHLQVSGPHSYVPQDDPTQGVRTVKRTVEGLSDFTAGVSYTFALPSQAGNFLRLTAERQFATGNVEKGLSTGSQDTTLTVDFYKMSGKNTYFGGVGYTKVGKIEIDYLLDTRQANVGLVRDMAAFGSGGFNYSVRSKSTAASIAQKELMVFHVYNVNEHTQLQSYVTKGFSKGTANWGGGLVVGRNF